MDEYAKAYLSSLAAISERGIDHGPHLSMSANLEEAQLDAMTEAHRRWPAESGWTQHHARVMEVRLDGAFADSMRLVEAVRVEEDADAGPPEPPDDVPLM